MENTHFTAISAVINQYFNGLHHGDVARLRRIFDPNAVLVAPGIRRTQDQWLALVAKRPKPAELGEPFAYQILAIEVMGQQAMVKAYCPLLGAHYLDYLGLLNENGQWRIVSKNYADYPYQQAEQSNGLITSTDEEAQMPYVNIKVTDEQVTCEQKKQLIEGTTKLLETVLNKNPASTFVLIEEVNTDNWGIGYNTVTELRQRQAATE